MNNHSGYFVTGRQPTRHRLIGIAGVLLVSVILLIGSVQAAPLGTAFTYQGQLRKNGSPYNGTCNFQFSLWDAVSGGAQIGSTLTQTGVTVSNGLFTVTLDFGTGVFTGDARWLQIAVQCSGDSGYTTLSPRQALTATPYAQYALGAPWSGLQGVPAGFADNVDNDTTYTAGTGLSLTGNQFSVDFAGNGTATTVARSDHTHWGQSWTGTGTGLTLSGGNIGLNASGTANGVAGYASATSGTTYGVVGHSASTSGSGVFGVATATSGTTYGVWGHSESTSGRGVFGVATATSGTTYGVWGHSESTSGRGVYGYAYASSGTTYGVYGGSDSSGGTGVYGIHYASTGTAPGVHGISNSTSAEAVGVLGEISSTNPGASSSAVRGINRGTGSNGFGVWGSHAGAGTGVLGSVGDNGTGVLGIAGNGGYGVFGAGGGSTGYAGYFSGRVEVTGNLSKGGGSFKIDHPLDPENKYLYHSFVESPDMKNIYDGVVVLDQNGEAWVELPAWFEALNRDFRYQLTPIGAPAPTLHIAQEIQNNRFQIAGGQPGMKVSWQVTGIRHDPYANAYRIPVEEDKPAHERGTYLYPEVYGQPADKGLDYQRNQALLEQSTIVSPASDSDNR